MKVFINFLSLWIFFTAFALTWRYLSKTERFGLIKCALFGLGTAVVTTLVLFLVVALF